MLKDTQTKWCRKGAHFAPVTEFSVSSSSKDGLQVRCKEHARVYYIERREAILARVKARQVAKAGEIRAYKQSYYQQNKTEILDSQKLYRQDNAVAISDQRRTHYATNKDEINERRRDAATLPHVRKRIAESRKAYRQRNLNAITGKEQQRRLTLKATDPERLRESQRRYAQSDKGREKQKEYRLAHPEHTRRTRRAAKIKRRALELAAQGVFTYNEWLAKCEVHGGRCYYCGKMLDELGAVREHRLPLSRSRLNWLSNVVPSCKRCNSRKGIRTEVEFWHYLKCSRLAPVALPLPK